MERSSLSPSGDPFASHVRATATRRAFRGLGRHYDVAAGSTSTTIFFTVASVATAVALPVISRPGPVIDWEDLCHAVLVISAGAASYAALWQYIKSAWNEHEHGRSASGIGDE